MIRYNEHGIAGLSDRHGGGRPAKLREEEKELLTKWWLRQGPDPQDGLVRWRLCDLRQRLMERCFVSLDKRSVSRILKALSFSHMSVRPRHPQADGKAQEADKKTLPTCRRCDPAARGARQTCRALVAG